MNILSLILNSEGVFKVHPGCEDLSLTHLAFADDLLIFINGTENSLQGVLSVLANFERISGFSVNIENNSLLCAGIEEETLERIQNRFGLSPTKLPVRCYLGLPLCSKKLFVADCDPLIAQLKKKFCSWTNRLLSLAGRFTLISSVISGIIGFWTSAFFLPKQVIRKIKS